MEEGAGKNLPLESPSLILQVLFLQQKLVLDLLGTGPWVRSLAYGQQFLIVPIHMALTNISEKIHPTADYKYLGRVSGKTCNGAWQKCPESWIHY